MCGKPKEGKNEFKNAWHSVITGFVAGAVASFATFPFLALKKKRQSGQSLPLNLFEIYRGVSSFTYCLTPTTMFQFSSEFFFRQYTNNPLAIAIPSGAFGAVASTIVENIILEQQRRKITPIQAISSLYRQGKNTQRCLKKYSVINYAKNMNRLWIGFNMLIVREAIFGGAMLFGADALGRKVKNMTDSDFWAFSSKIGLGIFCSLISHPFDTIATKKQCEKKPSSALFHFKNIFSKKGIKGFYPGGGWRCGLFSGTMIIMSSIKNSSIAYFDVENDNITARV